MQNWEYLTLFTLKRNNLNLIKIIKFIFVNHFLEKNFLNNFKKTIDKSEIKWYNKDNEREIKRRLKK